MLEPVEYFGSRLSLVECEAISFTRISAESRGFEPHLFETKWFDYRALHPVKATYLFAAVYKSVVDRLYRELKDHNSENAVAFTPEDVFRCRELGGFLKARQAFDRLGVRYGFGINFAMRQFIDRGWTIWPRPNQLYSEELLLDIRDAWKLECDLKLQIPTSQRYRVSNYTGHPDQIAWIKWAGDQIAKREFKGRALATYFANNFYPENVAIERFGSQATAEGRRFANSISVL